MVNIQIDLEPDVSKKLAIYKLENGHKTKAAALAEILGRALGG